MLQPLRHEFSGSTGVSTDAFFTREPASGVLVFTNGDAANRSFTALQAIAGRLFADYAD